jgi:superfamily II DNA or RNA helicase
MAEIKKTMEKPAVDPTAFTDADRLQLLQLLTRRSVAGRRDRLARREADDLGADQAAGRAVLDVPDRWRLLPDGITLYRWQQECLPLWLSKGRGTVKVATGGGKTLFALAVAQQLENESVPDLRLVIVVPTIPLMLQWYDEIRRGNLPESAIGLMGGGVDQPPNPELRILICVLNSARERLPGFVAKAHWAPKMLLVVDECHRANAEQARRIFDAEPKFTLGLSATPEQDLESEGLPTDEAYEKSVVGQALGPILYDFTLKQSLEAGLLTPFEVWHIGLPLSPTEGIEHARLSREITELRKSLQRRHRKSRSKQSFLAWCQTLASRGGPTGAEAEHFVGLANRRKRLLYKAKARTSATLGILSESVNDPDGRAIVFHESIDEIECLFLDAVENRLPVVLEHSQLPDSLRTENIDAFRQGVARVIISAKSLVEGFNVPSADLGIIAASSGSVRQRIQSLGRMLRRKSGGRSARIMVLYVRDTEDEAIYEKADWETIVGAERNRYFNWNVIADETTWPQALEEVTKPPRSYRPSCWEIDVTDLRRGDSYPGQPAGLDLRVDQSGNLRTDTDTLVLAAPELIAAILEQNPHRRARRTGAGHLIVRIDPRGSDEADWRYLGTIDLPDEPDEGTVVRLRVRTTSGRRAIGLEQEPKKGEICFALAPGASRTPEGGRACERLLEWTQKVGAERGVTVKEIFWDNHTNYWLEIGGERIPHDGPLAPLEFKL